MTFRATTFLVALFFSFTGAAAQQGAGMRPLPRRTAATDAEALRLMRNDKLDLIQVSSGNQMVPTATVRLIAPDGVPLVHTAIGTGPVDAAYQAINALVGIENELTEFHIKSVTEGIDAQGEVIVRISCNGQTYTGRGADTDIIVAAAKAVLQAINRALSVETPKDALVRSNP